MLFITNGVLNDVSYRAAVKTYDPDVYALIEEIWPCGNTYLPRCLSSRDWLPNMP
jgi:hypothetical protein